MIRFFCIFDIFCFENRCFCFCIEIFEYKVIIFWYGFFYVCLKLNYFIDVLFFFENLYNKYQEY